MEGGVAPAVKVRDLVVGYGERLILRGVDMTVQPGEIRVILGGSGCGKSTLLRSIVGLTPVTSGHIELLGEELTALSEQARAEKMKKVGVLFQNGALIGSLTIGENVALPLTAHTDLPPSVVRELVRMKLELVSMAHAEHLLPGQLSGGMKKRAALARAMALDPALLLCDEPSAGLDPLTSAELDALLVGLRDRFGMTVLVVTHELPSIELISDTAVMLVAGKAVAEGTLAEVKASDRVEVQEFFARAPGPSRLRGQSLLERMG